MGHLVRIDHYDPTRDNLLNHTAGPLNLAIIERASYLWYKPCGVLRLSYPMDVAISPVLQNDTGHILTPFASTATFALRRGE